MNAQDRAVRDRNNARAQKEDGNLTTATKKQAAKKDTGPNGPVKTTKVAAETMAALENDLQSVQAAVANGKVTKAPRAKRPPTIAEDIAETAAEKTARKGKASAERHAKAADQ